MTAHAHGSTAGLLPLTLMWFGMMAAMMAPTVWPWVRSFGRFDDSRSGLAAAAAVGTFAGGYLAAWLAYSVPRPSFSRRSRPPMSSILAPA